MTRHEKREEIFRVVFSLDTQKEADPSASVSDIVYNYIVDSCKYEPDKDEALAIYDKAVAIGSMLGTLDSEINAVAEGWKTNRMGRAELNILRVAVYEIRYDDSIPVKVAIDEAVELAKEYCGDGAPAFINGMLKHFV